MSLLPLREVYVKVIGCLASNSAFRNNIILNTIGELDADPWQGNIRHGLWLEYIHDYHDNTLINNTVAWNPQQGIWVAGNVRTTVTGNVCYGNGGAQLRVDAFEGHGGLTGQNNKFQGSQFYSTASTQQTFSYQWDCNYGTTSGNWYCSPNAAKVINAATGPMTPQEWYAAFPAIGDATAKTDLIKRPAGTPAANLVGTSKLLINETGQRKAVPVGDAGIYKDLSGNTVIGSATIEPYSSLIVVHTGQVSTGVLGGANPAVRGVRVCRTPGRPIVASLAMGDRSVPVVLRITDARGALVASVEGLPAGEGMVAAWDGTRSGRPASTGWYHYAIRAGGERICAGTTLPAN